MNEKIFQFKEKIKKSKCLPVVALANLYVTIYCIPRSIRKISSILIFFLSRLFPLQNKIIATAFTGKKYGDNPQQIIEKIHSKNPSIKIIWLKNPDFKFSTPDYVKTVSAKSYWKKAYEMATAKIWLDTHLLEFQIKKRNPQLFIETWHGGLGVKKIEFDSPILNVNNAITRKIRNTAKLADLFISNSNHLTNIYKTAFRYSGPIWQIGYPKNDILFNKKERNIYQKSIRQAFSIPIESKIIVYAPTFRDGFSRFGLNNSIYEIDYSKLKMVLKQKFGGEWYILVRFHPVMRNCASSIIGKQSNVIDATQYPDSQELILGCNAFISDYSSMLFDAAMTNIPCFTYAKDYAEYENGRGLYYKLEDLPFPLATTDDELMVNIQNFDLDSYQSKWDNFKKRMGLVETDSSADKIADLVIDVIENGKGVIEKHLNA